MKKNIPITFSPHHRILATGCHIEVRQNSNQFRVLLKHADELIAEASAPRGGSMSPEQALNKARAGEWGPSSGFRQVLDRFADIAEQQFATHNNNNK